MTWNRAFILLRFWCSHNSSFGSKCRQHGFKKKEREREGGRERERERKGAHALREDASLFHAVEVLVDRLTSAAVSCRSSISQTWCSGFPRPVTFFWSSLRTFAASAKRWQPMCWRHGGPPGVSKSLTDSRSGPHVSSSCQARACGSCKRNSKSRLFCQMGAWNPEAGCVVARASLALYVSPIWKIQKMWNRLTALCGRTRQRPLCACGPRQWIRTWRITSLWWRLRQTFWMQLNRRLTWILSRLWWTCWDQSKCSVEASIDAQGRLRPWTTTWSSRDAWKMLSMSWSKTRGSLTFTFDAFLQNKGTALVSLQIKASGRAISNCWQESRMTRLCSISVKEPQNTHASKKLMPLS